jgi:predicted DsbA family dithiol-disulfide isomerase
MIARPRPVAPTMRVEVWSDVVCPWCYIGKRNLEAALAGFEHADDVEVVWRSFELDPGAPTRREGPYVERLARKYRTTVDEAQAMIDRMTAAGAAVGLDLRFDIAQPGSTFDAHRLLHLAAERGLQGDLKERLLRATFTEGEPIGEHDALVRLAADVGLDAGEVRVVLASDAHADAVRAEEAEAATLDIAGVPFFVVDRAFGISGAHPPEALRRILAKAWARSHPPALVVGDGGAAPACEGDACTT